MELSHIDACKLLADVFARFPNIVPPEDISFLARCLKLESFSDKSIMMLDSILAHYNDIFGDITPQMDALMNWCFDKFILLYGGKGMMILGSGKYKKDNKDNKILCEEFYLSEERDIIKKLAAIYNLCDITHMVTDLCKCLFRNNFGDGSNIIMQYVKSIFITRGLGLRSIVTIELKLKYIGNDACMKDCIGSSSKNMAYRKIIILCIRYIHKTIRSIFEKYQHGQLLDYIDFCYEAEYCYQSNIIAGGVFHYFPNIKNDYSDELSFSTNNYAYHITSPPPQLTCLLYGDDISMFKYQKSEVQYYNWIVPVIIINCINDFCDKQQQVTHMLITSLLSQKVHTYSKERDTLENMIKKAITSLKETDPPIYSTHDEHVKYTLGNLYNVLSNNDCIEMINNLYSEIPKFITENSTLMDKIYFFRHVTKNKVLFAGVHNEHIQTTLVNPQTIRLNISNIPNIPNIPNLQTKQ